MPAAARCARRKGTEPVTDEELRRHIARSVDEQLQMKWPEVDELWLRQVRPLLAPEMADEEFMKRVAMPLSLRLISIGVQAGIFAVATGADVFEKPFEFVVAPSGTVSIRFEGEGLL
jgi:hypothetical protein